MIARLEAPGLLIPLEEGVSFVGRKRFSTPLLEAAQWMIECHPGSAEVWDAASTNLSYIINVALSEVPFAKLRGMEGAIEIPHANLGLHKLPLRDGDVLRGIYAAFVFKFV